MFRRAKLPRSTIIGEHYNVYMSNLNLSFSQHLAAQLHQQTHLQAKEEEQQQQ